MNGIPLNKVITNLHEKLSKELEEYKYKGKEESIVHQVADAEENKATEELTEKFKIVQKKPTSNKNVNEIDIIFDVSDEKNSVMLVPELFRKLSTKIVDNTGDIERKVTVVGVFDGSKAVKFEDYINNLRNEKVDANLFNKMKFEGFEINGKYLIKSQSMTNIINIINRQKEIQQKQQFKQSDTTEQGNQIPGRTGPVLAGKKPVKNPATGKVIKYL